MFAGQWKSLQFHIIIHKQCDLPQQTFTCSKSAIETLNKDTKMSSLLTLNIFHTFFQCFYCSIWTSKCLLGLNFQKYFPFHNIKPKPSWNNHNEAIWNYDLPCHLNLRMKLWQLFSDEFSEIFPIHVETYKS